MDSFFNKCWLTVGLSFCKQSKYFDVYLIPCTKINSKQRIDQSTKPKILKFLEENMGDIMLSERFPKHNSKDRLHEKKLVSWTSTKWRMKLLERQQGNRGAIVQVVWMLISDATGVFYQQDGFTHWPFPRWWREGRATGNEQIPGEINHVSSMLNGLICLYGASECQGPFNVQRFLVYMFPLSVIFLDFLLISSLCLVRAFDLGTWWLL